ncbi:MAG: cysteine desulfurase [Patescibacteria group bacterium]|nr:cysteine desulfurase [Patescibacteria group bacterium]
MERDKKIYLDYAATTPVDPAVWRAMKPYFAERFGNPGSLHSFGQEAIAAVDRSRETVAKAIGADFREVIFTGSATEANNLALRGVASGFSRMKSGSPRMIISSIEHESVFGTAHDLGRSGVEVVYLPVDQRGTVDLKKLKESLNERTILISIMYANNEIGVIEPIKEIAAIIKEFRGKEEFPIVHTDASQAFQFLDCDVKNLGIDLMTLSAHKIYGPKGIGALYVGNKERGTANKEGDSLVPVPFSLSPILTGGGQEFGFRSGTENVPAIVGFAKATELLLANSRELANKKIAALRGRLWKGIKKAYPKAELNGISEKEIHSPFSILHSPFLPNILNVYFPGCEAQDLLTKFDLGGLAVSSGSACRSRAMESSYVIEALNQRRATGNGKRARSSIRFSLGRPTTKREIDTAIKAIESCL